MGITLNNLPRIPYCKCNYLLILHFSMPFFQTDIATTTSTISLPGGTHDKADEHILRCQNAKSFTRNCEALSFVQDMSYG